MTKSKLNNFFRNIFKFLYNSKPDERQPKPVEAKLRLIPASGSSQEQLIRSANEVVDQKSSDSSSCVVMEEIDLQKTEFYDIIDNVEAKNITKIEFGD